MVNFFYGVSFYIFIVYHISSSANAHFKPRSLRLDYEINLMAYCYSSCGGLRSLYWKVFETTAISQMLSHSIQHKSHNIEKYEKWNGERSKCGRYNVDLDIGFERDKSVWVIKPIQLSTRKQHAIGIAEARIHESYLQDVPNRYAKIQLWLVF